MPTLEVISRLPSGQRHPVPLLFVHGAFSGAWIWDAKFLRRFAGLGFPAHALSLRGHGASDGQEVLHLCGIAEFVADVADAVGRMDTPPVLIGHSMGGFVVQEYMRGGGRASGVVLMASVPPHGLFDCLAGMTYRNTDAVVNLAMMQTWGKSAVNLDVIGRALFSDRMSPAEMRRYEACFQPESGRVAWELLALPALRAPWKPGDLPVLVLGAELDRFVPPQQVELTACTLGTSATILRGMAHAMMLDPLWESAVDLIAHWVERTVLR